MGESYESGEYSGPEFQEYCISESAYLSSHRDRSPCRSCALQNLCEAGFEEQKRRALLGINPSLTDDAHFSMEQLTPVKLFEKLTDKQREFVIEKIPSLKEE
ncbi:hypothetical protein [Micromonospora sp. NPDC048063]|uniref:hypothetical protein n=1 Tax=Micromonospora sp. NPDC048063 TaxID=3364256 RepID=UPI0037101298